MLEVETPKRSQRVMSVTLMVSQYEDYYGCRLLWIEFSPCFIRGGGSYGFAHYCVSPYYHFEIDLK